MQGEDQGDKPIETLYREQRSDALLRGAEDCNLIHVSLLGIGDKLRVLSVCQDLTTLLGNLLLELSFQDVCL